MKDYVVHQQVKLSTMQFEEKRLNISAETISYYDSEIGTTTLLFIHGAFIKKGYWDSQTSYFADRYRVVAMDLAGHGNSTSKGDD